MNDVYTDKQDDKPDNQDNPVIVYPVIVYPVIVCIAKKETDYIEEFVKYHLALGFEYIYIYDNEDVPTYENILNKYIDKIKVIHLPNNNYYKPVQYMALDDFIVNYLNVNDKITHVIHIDIDEFIVLKKHNNICDFITEYIINDCEGIAINWRFFGSGGLIQKTSEPVTCRFTTCEINGNKHIKTLFKKDNFARYNTCHDVYLSKGFIKNTKGGVVNGPYNEDIDFSVIQLNHYKCKTYTEYFNSRQRGRADKNNHKIENRMEINSSFNTYDINEVHDMYAKKFYESIK
jgi:hypothetical protein